MKGYRVRVPILGNATIVGQVATGHFPFVLVEADEPMPFDEYVDAKEKGSAFSTEAKDMEYWVRQKAFLVLPHHLQRRAVVAVYVYPLEVAYVDHASRPSRFILVPDGPCLNTLILGVVFKIQKHSHLRVRDLDVSEDK